MPVADLGPGALKGVVGALGGHAELVCGLAGRPANQGAGQHGAFQRAERRAGGGQLVAALARPGALGGAVGAVGQVLPCALGVLAAGVIGPSAA